MKLCPMIVISCCSPISKVHIVSAESGTIAKFVGRIAMHVDVLVVVGPVVVRRGSGPVVGVLAEAVIVPRVAQVAEATGCEPVA